jgi:hypothetical protein
MDVIFSVLNPAFGDSFYCMGMVKHSFGPILKNNDAVT